MSAAVLLSLRGPPPHAGAAPPRTPRGLRAGAGLGRRPPPRGQARPADALVDALVDAGLVEDLTPNGLQAQVHRLRTRLGTHGGVLQHLPAGYRLGGLAFVTDLDLVETRASQAARARVNGDFASAADRVDEALALWRGDLLEDLAELHELAPLRTRFVRLREELRRQVLSDRLLSRDPRDLDAVVGELQARVDEDAGDELAWVQLMVAHYVRGSAAHALDSYRLARRRLRDDAGLEPSPRMRAVESAVLRQAPVSAVLRAAQLAAAVGPGPAVVWVAEDGRPRRRALVGTEPLTIGRSPGADIRLAGRSVSRWHAALSPSDGGWLVRDLGSRNGTLLDGSPVGEGALVAPGSVVCCGAVSVLVVPHGAEAEAEALTDCLGS